MYFRTITSLTTTVSAVVCYYGNHYKCANLFVQWYPNILELTFLIPAQWVLHARKIFWNEKGLRSGLLHSTSQKSKVTRGDAITNLQSHSSAQYYGQPSAISVRLIRMTVQISTWSATCLSGFTSLVPRPFSMYLPLDHHQYHQLTTLSRIKKGSNAKLQSKLYTSNFKWVW